MSLPTDHAAGGAAGGDAGALARRLVSNRTGVLASLSLFPRDAGDVRAFHIAVETPRYSRMVGGGDIEGTGGSHYDLAGAHLRGLFEGIERYCGGFSDDNQLLLARADEGGPYPFLHGEALPLYADVQYRQPGFPFRPLTAASRIHWREARSLVTGALWYVPASLVPVPYQPRTDDENLGPTTSIGMAAADSWARAVLTGLFEICEREAFAIMWLNRLTMPRVRVPPGSALGEELRRLLGPESRLTFVDITSDLGIPTALAVLERPLHGRPLVTMGASAKTTRAAACRKAALEALGCYARVRQEYFGVNPAPWVPAEDFSNVDDYTKHSLLYVDPRLHGELAFITAGQEVDLEDEDEGTSTPPEELLRYTRRVAERAGEVLVVTLTTPEIAALGGHVVKVVVPQAVPLNPHHLHPPLGHRRLYQVPRLLGYRATDSTPAELNLKVPHPFP